MSALLQTTGDAPGFIRCVEAVVERGRNGMPSPPRVANLPDLQSAVAELRPALRIPEQQAGLDPLTGLADRRWFDHAMAQSESQTGRERVDVGIIALDIDGLRRVNERDGRDVGDGILLLTAELLHTCSRREDLAARLGDDDFAVLAHTDAVGLAAAAARLREMLLEAGVAASVGAAMRANRGGLSAALRMAAGEVRANKATQAGNPTTAHGAPRSAEAAASRAVIAARSAIRASVTQAQATGILMQWHHCAPERALLELAYQAHELGLPVTAMARLLVAVASGVPLADEDVARGIELDRSLPLAAHVDTRGDIARVDRTPHVRAPAAGSVPAIVHKPGQMQPIWTIRPPNAASGILALSALEAPTSARELQIAGRYQGAASRVGSGGDWFDAFALPEGTAALVLGDVAGHDALAAATMMQLRTLLRGLAVGRDIAPSAVLRSLDRYFVRLGLGLLATVFFGWVETDATGRVVLRWCSAGHLPPVLLTADGDAVMLDCVDDLLLGLGVPVRRGNLSLSLPPGSTLLLYSDGLVETRRASLDDGMARLCAAARPLASLGVTELCDTLMSAMVGARTPDDVTLMAIRVPVPPDDLPPFPVQPAGVVHRP